jgi:hypothetical protein
MESSIFDNEETLSEPFAEQKSTKKHKIKSSSKLSTNSDARPESSDIQSISASIETEPLPEAIEKQLTTVKPPQAKANEIQTSTITEVIKYTAEIETNYSYYL